MTPVETRAADASIYLSRLNSRSGTPARSGSRVSAMVSGSGVAAHNLRKTRLTPLLAMSRCEIAVAVCELLNGTRRRLMKFGDMFNQLKAGTEFAVKRIGVVANNV